MIATEIVILWSENYVYFDTPLVSEDHYLHDVQHTFFSVICVELRLLGKHSLFGNLCRHYISSVTRVCEELKLQKMLNVDE